MTLEFPDARHVLSSVFKYTYTSEVDVSPETIVPILQQAQFYLMPELSKMLKREIEREMLPKHVLLILRDAVEFRMDDLIQYTSGVLAENFDAVDWPGSPAQGADGLWHGGVDLNFLPVDTLLNILSNR
jgi:hypothetical protein